MRAAEQIGGLVLALAVGACAWGGSAATGTRFEQIRSLMRAGELAKAHD